MTSEVNFTLIDRSAEKTRTRIYLPQVNAGNYDTVTGDGVGENVGDLRIAMNGIITGNHVQRRVTCEVYLDSAVLPTSPWSQREIKSVWTYIDTVTNKVYNMEVGTADLDNLAEPGTDVIDITAGQAALWVAALEANAVSEAGNAIQVQSAKIVGRNI